MCSDVTNLYKFSAHPRSNFPHIAIFPPDGTCVPLALSSFCFLPTLPFTFGACHWPWSWVQTKHSRNRYFCMSFDILFLCGPSEICVSRAVLFRGEGKSDTSAYIEGANIRTVDSVSQPLWDRGPVNPFFIRRGPGPNKFSRKYLPNFFLSSYVKLT